MGSAERSRLLRNWQAERDSAMLYDALAALERNRARSEIYRGLAAAELAHAAFWEGRLRQAGQPVPRFRRSLRTSLLIGLARYLGVAFVAPSITVREMRDRDHYARQHDALVAGLAEDEQGHAAIMRGATHVGLGNNLRAAVLGANDGLASNFCLIMGVAGGGASTATILLTGVAGLIGGACSMALGEWLSVTNAHELLESMMEREAADGESADRSPVGQPERGSQSDGMSAGSAAAVSALLFGLGAVVPVAPFCFLSGTAAVAGSAMFSGAALLGIGAATSLFNGRSVAFASLRQLLIGAAAAALTFLAGRIVGQWI